MRGHVILSHGTDSGPDATKVSLLARVAESLGWSAERPDYRDCDAGGYGAAVPCRVDRLRERIDACEKPPVLVGSSMGAFVSGLASLRSTCAALFLMALPVTIPGVGTSFDMDRGVPSMLMHGFADELCPADAAMAFAAQARMPALLVADGHRLADHVDVIASQFQLFMEHLST